MEKENSLSRGFSKAAKDYLFLLNRGYPETPAVTLVGNRYRLDKTERMILFRGICSSPRAITRRDKLSASSPGETLTIDGYNLLFTLLNYRLGKRMFLGYDGFLRDAGGTHGRFSERELFISLAGEMIRFLKTLGVAKIKFYLDSPVSHSAEHARALRRILEETGLPGECITCDSADFRVKQAKEGLVVTSDTAIIDSTPLPVFDGARNFLQDRFGASFLDLQEILSSP